MEQTSVGVDVAKEQLDVHVRPTGTRFAVAGDESGILELVKRLQRVAPTVVVLEATGGYEVAVAAALATAGLPVAVVNPRQVRDFARATGRFGQDRRAGCRDLSAVWRGGAARRATSAG
jgi:transposase